MELSRRPDIYDRVHNELKQLYPSGDASDLNYQRFQNGTPYLGAVINEALRLNPPIHLTARATKKPLSMTTPTGKPFILWPGVIAYFSIYHVHTSEALWGSDAKSFNPERFLQSKESGEILDGQFMPFGYGRRSCVGFKFAPLTIKIHLALVLRHYRIEVHDHIEDINREGPLLESSDDFDFTAHAIYDSIL